MPRIARTVFAGVPHHITQRGNRREDVFFTDADRAAYLTWLGDYCARHHVKVLAYCLMTNHVHIVAIPGSDQALEQVFRPLHTRYAQRLNRAKGWKGHVWQGRFFSSALDDDYLWTAIRYVERNPVRARLVRRGENYPWSSAAAHCGLKADSVLTADPEWYAQKQAIGDWSAWLAEVDAQEQVDLLRRHVERGLPCGNESFVKKLERRAGHLLRPRPRGRPRKS